SKLQFEPYLQLWGEHIYSERSCVFCPAPFAVEQLVLHRRHRLPSKFSPGDSVAEHLRGRYRTNNQKHRQHFVDSLWWFRMAAHQVQRRDQPYLDATSQFGLDWIGVEGFPIR